MAIVIAALLPVFLLIVLGFVLKRSLMRLETQWHGLERLTYYVLFPALLIQTLVKADLSSVPVAGVGGALLLSALVMSLLCLGLRPLLSRLAIDGPAFTSIFLGATRWQTYVALAVSGNLYGEIGLALASVAMVAIIPLVNVFSVAVLAHYASPEKQSVRAIAMTVVRNPPDLGLRHRTCNRCHAHAAAAYLARGRRRARPLLARDRPARHRRRPAPRRHVPPEPGRQRRRVPQAGRDARARDRTGAVVRPFRLQSFDRGGMLGGAGVVERLCAGPADGRRRASAGANHHAADHSRGHHHADRDCAGGVDRHCEPPGRANARPMTGATKQSRAVKNDWIASSQVLLAMTLSGSFDSNFKQQMCVRILAAGYARALRFVVPQKREQGMPDARCTRGLVCKMEKRKRTRAYRFSGGNPTFPAQWLYGLLRALPGESGFVVSVVCE
jgi:hypothetical protein